MSTHPTTATPSLRLPATLALRTTRLQTRVAVAVAGLVALLGAFQVAAVENGATGTLVGIALVAVSRPLARGRRRAQLAALGLVGASLLLDADHTGRSAAMLAIAAVTLVLATPAFPATGDPATRRTLAPAGVLLAIGLAADLAYARGAVAHPLAVTLVIAALLLGSRALRTWSAAARVSDADRRRAAELVRTGGTDTLAPFALRSDKRPFFDATRGSMLGYRVIAGVALVSGDPIGDERRFRALTRDFVAFARTRGWTVAALGQSSRHVGLWQDLGLRAHYTGDEAIVDPRTFSLEGRAVRKVRQSVQRLEREGYEARLLRSAEIDGDLAAQLKVIADRWRGAARETGFSMAFDGADVRPERDDVYMVAFDATRAPRGFLHFGSAPAARALSLSSMRRDRDTPNGLNEFLIVRTLEWAREHGLEHVSLNFAAFALLLDPPGELDAVAAFERRALKHLEGRFQLERLLCFSEKFSPSWTPRYAAYPSLASVPRVALAAMLAESYVALPRVPWTRGEG
jgi:lysyl-tRNA synthetase class 2